VPAPPAGSNGHQPEAAPATSTEELAIAAGHDG
jgi:hypothetical protein